MEKILFIILMMNFNLFSQHQELVLIDEGQLTIDSALDPVQYEFLGPKNFHCFDGNMNSPLFVVFDKQNELGYNQILSNIDLMVSLGNIPSSSVLGISFTENNRKKLTMYKSESGEMDCFMKQLVKMIDSLKGGDGSKSPPIILVGHSRTAYLSIQLLINYSNEFNGVFASSPWHFNVKEKDIYLSFIDTLKKKKYLYANSGSDELLDNEFSFNNLSSFVDSNKSKYIESCFTVNKCDHILSRNIDFIKNTTDFFYHYQLALMKSLNLFDKGCFKKNSIYKVLDSASNLSGYKINIDDVFLYSGYNKLLSGIELNEFEKEDILDFLCLAKYYSMKIKDPFIYYLIADCYQKIGEIKERNNYIFRAIEASENYLWKNEDEQKLFILELNQSFELDVKSLINKEN